MFVFTITEMIPLKPKFLRILEAQCQGIINIPSLDFLKTSLFCNGVGSPELVATFILPAGGSTTAIKFNNLDPINTPGTKMYVVSNTGDIINQYALIDPFDFRTNLPTLTAETFDTSLDELVPTGMEWSDDGKELFIVGDQKQTIFQYGPAGTAYDLGTVSTTKRTNTLAAGQPTPTGLVFDNNGSKLFSSGGAPNRQVRQFTLGINYSVQGINTNDGAFDTTPQVQDARSMTWSIPLGNKMFLLDRNIPRVVQYSVQNAFDLLTGTITITKEFDLTPFGITGPFGMTLSNDELQMFILDFSGKVFQFTLPSQFQL